MRRKAVSGMMLPLLLISSFILMFNVQPVATGNTIYIRTDGSVDPPTAPIQRDGDIYTFTDNINDSIVVERSNIIIDGVGYILQGSGGWGQLGVSMTERSSVTIKNVKIRNFGTGIYLYNSCGNTLSGNTVSGCLGCGIYVYYYSNSNVITNNIVDSNGGGIDIDRSFYNTLSHNIVSNNRGYTDAGIRISNLAGGNILINNTVLNNKYGIRLTLPAKYYLGNTLSKNRMSGNDYNLLTWGPQHDIDTTNTVDGKPVYYVKGARNQVYGSETNAGVFYGFGCYNVTLKDLTLTKNNYGVYFERTSNSRIVNVTTLNNIHGIGFVSSSNDNILTNSTVSNSLYDGVQILESPGNTIADNIISNNTEGMYIGGSSRNTAAGNIILNNVNGILLYHESDNNVFVNNIISNNQIGINLTYFSIWSRRLPQNNTICNNNFINNSQQVYIRESEPGNFFDSGYPGGGNYWSDYTDVDLYSGPYQNETGSDGIWDHPYVIDANNTDRYPLVNPWTPTPTPKFRIGDWVQTTSNLNVRDGPGLGYAIIDTMPLGTIGQIVGGPVEADGFVWWDVDYAVGVRGWSAENWLELYPVLDQPPTCVVKLQKDGVEIDEIDVWEFFDIYVGDSTGDKGIKQVRFSSDNVQDGYPTGEWTDWFNWNVSSEDWNATTKIKRWAFATPGYKEVWAEVKDETDQTAFGLATIFVPAPALPVLTSPLVITPAKDIYNVGDSLEAEFTIKNIGDVPIALDVLTVGGRLNGFIPPEGTPDFTFQSVTLLPNEPYQYQGSLTLNQIGNYRFFIAYYIENPTPDEERLLDENNWNTCVELGEGLTHTDRVKSIIVYEEDIVPDDVTQLRNLINRLKEQSTYIPPYLLDDQSFGGSVATLWMYWKSFFTDSWETYDMHYFAGLDYEYLRVKSLILTGHSLDRGDLEYARKLVQMSIEYGQLSYRSFDGAFQVYDRNVEQAEVIARFVKDRCQAIVVAGLTVVNPTAGKVLDYAFLGTDYLINRELLGEEQATKILVRDGVVKFLFNEWQFFDGMTLSEAVEVNPPFEFTALQNYIMMNEELPDLLYDVIKQWIYDDVAQSLSILIADWLSSGVDYQQAEEFSPVELCVYDSGGKIAGVIDGEVRHEISRSVYKNGTVTIFFPLDTYCCELAGTDEGTYGLEITSVIAGNVTSFTATAIPTLPNATHQYTVDWDALSAGEEGVTVLVDVDGDGVVERIFSSDSELTGEEFVEKTSPTYPTYALTIITSEGGTTYPPLGTYTCSANSTVHVTAFPDEGYVLDYWELDSANMGSNNPYTVLMDTNHTLNAVFRLGIYDIAVTNVSPSKTVVSQGYSMSINVTVENQGDYTEIFNVSVFYDDTVIILPDGKNHTTTTLTSGNSTTLTFTWNTTGVAKGNHTIKARATPVPGEVEIMDNTLIDGWVIVAMVGDLSGPEGFPDGLVDIDDVVFVAVCFGSYPGKPNWSVNADITGPEGVPDGLVDIDDVTVPATHFGEIDP